MKDLIDNSEKLAKLSHELCKDREEAVKARANSGLEKVWKKARDQYAGMDSTNTGWTKGETLDGPVRTASNESKKNRSTVLVNITRPYTNAGTARVADILLPTGKMPWDIEITPVSDLQDLLAAADDYPEEITLMLNSYPELLARISADEEQSKLAAKAAKDQITDWLIQTDWINAVRQQISEAGITGTGILKGPFSKKRKLSPVIEEFINNAPQLASSPEIGVLIQKQLQARLYYTPATECIKVENLYPAPECGSDIQSGRFIFEKIPDVSRRQLMEMKRDETYLADQIQACIEEGAKKKGQDQQNKNIPYDLWLRTGMIDLGDDEEDLIFSSVVLCNDRIIKISQPALDKETFLYRLLLWETRDDSWAGIGVPELMETPQRGLTGVVRALMDNMAYAVGPQILVNKGLMEPFAGDDWVLRPWKQWEAKNDAMDFTTSKENKKPFELIEFPSYLDPIMPVIQFWLKMAEDTTGLPLLLQGQSKNEAVGVNQQLMNNSTTNLRQIIKRWDDVTCRPQIQDYYDWCQQYGPETAKGDATVKAIGSSTMLVKELQMQAMLQIGDRVVQPVYGKSPKKWMNTFLEGFQIDPESLKLDEEEQKQLEAAANAPDPAVTVAQIRAETDTSIAFIKKEVDEFKAILSSQAKAADIEQARDETETRAATEIAKTSMQGDQQKEAAAQSGGFGPGSSSQPMKPAASEDLNIDAALESLGFE